MKPRHVLAIINGLLVAAFLVPAIVETFKDAYEIILSADSLLIRKALIFSVAASVSPALALLSIERIEDPTRGRILFALSVSEVSMFVSIYELSGVPRLYEGLIVLVAFFRFFSLGFIVESLEEKVGEISAAAFGIISSIFVVAYIKEPMIARTAALLSIFCLKRMNEGLKYESTKNYAAFGILMANIGLLVLLYDAYKLIEGAFGLARTAMLVINVVLLRPIYSGSLYGGVILAAFNAAYEAMPLVRYTPEHTISFRLLFIFVPLELVYLAKEFEERVNYLAILSTLRASAFVLINAGYLEASAFFMFLLLSSLSLIEGYSDHLVTGLGAMLSPISSLKTRGSLSSLL